MAVNRMNEEVNRLAVGGDALVEGDALAGFLSMKSSRARIRGLG